MIWAGPNKTPTSFVKLHELIKGELGRFGSAEGEEIFMPHVTLGRIDRKLPADSRRMIWDSINRSGLYIDEKAIIDGVHLCPVSCAVEKLDMNCWGELP